MHAMHGSNRVTTRCSSFDIRLNTGVLSGFYSGSEAGYDKRFLRNMTRKNIAKLLKEDKWTLELH
jgi:hypothetical protein